MNNVRRAELLSINTHLRQGWVHIAQAKIKAGDSDYGEDYPYLIDQVKVDFIDKVFGDYSWIEYDVVDGVIVGLALPHNVYHYFVDPDNPVAGELDLLAMIDDDLYQRLVGYCDFLENVIDNGGGVRVWLKLVTDECMGCGKKIEVNYKHGEGSWRALCGGSPRCCP